MTQEKELKSTTVTTSLVVVCDGEGIHIDYLTPPSLDHKPEAYYYLLGQIKLYCAERMEDIRITHKLPPGIINPFEMKRQILEE